MLYKFPSPCRSTRGALRLAHHDWPQVGQMMHELANDCPFRSLGAIITKVWGLFSSEVCANALNLRLVVKLAGRYQRKAKLDFIDTCFEDALESLQFEKCYIMILGNQKIGSEKGI
jgi:hypothetical protein